MKVCLLNTYEHDGGAARACTRLYDGLLKYGIDTSLLVREKSSDSISVKTSGTRYGGWLRSMVDEFLLYRYPSRVKHNFSPALASAAGISQAMKFDPDVLHLHWIPKGFVCIDDLQGVSVPIVWTMHDSWPFTGGCHLPGNCMKYEDSCGACPVLGSQRHDDLSKKVWKSKAKHYPLNRMTMIAPSQWLAGQARRSSLLHGCKVEVIPNGLDTGFYAPGNQRKARSALNLPFQRKIILFGGKSVLSDPNKGADLLWKALDMLPIELKQQSLVVVFGEEHNNRNNPTDLEVVNYGVVNDESKIVELYRAADILVMTSLQENLPNMILEGMSCGLPCVAFAVGGITEQIHHRRNGCLVEHFDVYSMSSELGWLLSAGDQLSQLGAMAREDAVNRYSLEKVARQHLALYEQIIKSDQ